jgi:hypothetical protein
MRTRSPRIRASTLPAIAALVSLLVACRSAVPPAEPPAARSGDISPEAIARRTVAAETGVEETSVIIISVTQRQFPDTSLGCPEADRVYPQVITPGHQIIAEASGQRFDVRVSGRGGRICRNAR